MEEDMQPIALPILRLFLSMVAAVTAISALLQLVGFLFGSLPLSYALSYSSLYGLTSIASFMAARLAHRACAW
jgi:hypothetical protein